MSNDGIVVGVDVGSGAARALAMTRAGEVVGSAVASYDADASLPIGEVDPETWLTGLCDAVTSLGERPVALGVGGHGPTTVASSGERALTFRHPAGESSSPTEQHAAHSRLLRETYGSDVQPRQQWDWLLAKLGGPADVQSVWPGVAPLPDFGDPVPVGSPVGVSSGECGLPAGTTLAPGSNDAYLTAWAAGIDVPGKGFDPGGRTGGLGVAVAAGAHEEIASYGMPSAVGGVYIVGGPVAAHGALLDWWSKITGRSLAELLHLATEVPPGAHGVMALPFLEGERAPRWNPDLRAEIVGLHVDSDVGVVTRALLESTAYGLGHIARDLKDQGVTLERLVCSGGPSRSGLWTEIKAAVLEVPVDVPDCDEMAAYGAALGAGAAVGWWPGPGEGSSGDWPMPAMKTIEADPLEVYRVGLDKFIELGNRAAGSMA